MYIACSHVASASQPPGVVQVSRFGKTFMAAMPCFGFVDLNHRLVAVIFVQDSREILYPFLSSLTPSGPLCFKLV